MRVLRLGLGDDQVVDLHPSISVVSELTDHQRDELRRAFRAIGTGLAPRADGLLEAHGILLDATQDDLDLLEIPRTAAETVVTAVEVPGAVPPDDAERLRTAERDLLLLAAARWRSGDELARSEAATARPSRASLRARAAELQARIGRYDATDAEPVRVALDGVRDRLRTGTTPDASVLAEALAGIGLDVRDLGLAVEEVVRLAEDWLDERQEEAARLVGAGVELDGIELALAIPEGPPAPGALDELRRRARQASEAHAAAIGRADALRRELAVRHAPRPAPEELERHLAVRLVGHRPDRLAGAVPMLLDGVLSHLGGPDVAALLDRIVGLAEKVQVVVVDDHPAAGQWAEAAGPRRAAVVAPAAARPTEASA